MSDKSRAANQRVLDHFIAGFRSRFPEHELEFTPDDAMVVIPVVGQEIDRIEVEDDIDELVVFAGNITHAHFGCHDRSLSDEARGIETAHQVLDFLAKVFANQVEFYRHPAGGGGWRVTAEVSKAAPGWSIGMQD